MEISIVLTNDTGEIQAILGQFIATAIAETAADRAAADADAAAALASQQAAAGSATSAAGSATTATGAASAASASATAAAGSATAAQGSQTAAASSASAAAGSATAAQGSQTAAASSATAAATSAAAAAATLANALVKANNLADVASPSAARGNLGAGTAGGFTFRNKVVNGNFNVNQRVYASGTATVVANQYTLDCWRVVTSGQNLAYAASGNGNIVTAPAGGLEQTIEGANIEGGTYVASWTGAGTCTVNGTAIANGGNVALPANTNVVIHLVGAVSKFQLELGTVPTAFEFRPVSIEIGICQRYAWRLVSSLYGACNGASGGNVAIQFPVQMRATPTYTNTSNGSALDGLAFIPVSAMTLASGNNNGAQMNFATTTATTAGRPALISGQVGMFSADF